MVPPSTVTTAVVNETCFEAAKLALNDQFTFRVSTDFEMFTFRPSKQLDGEYFGAFQHDSKNQKKTAASTKNTGKLRPSYQKDALQPS